MRRRTRRRPKKSATMKMVKRVARQQALAVAETHRFAILNENWTPGATTTASYKWFFRNVFSTLEYGAAAYESIGDEIQKPFLKFKYSITVPWTQIIGDRPDNFGYAIVVVALIAANEQYPGESIQDYSSLTGWFYNADPKRLTWNGNNVKVLKQRTHIIKADTIGLSTGAISAAAFGTGYAKGSFKYRWKGKVNFEDSSVIPPDGGPTRTRVTRGWNYYMVTGYGLDKPLISTANSAWPQMLGDSFLYFKDP